MKRILNIGNFSLTRLVLLIGVMSAIVFSNGEGISLLPFSQTDFDREISLNKLSEKQVDDYVFSVHGAGNLRNSLVSKYQKNLKNFSLASFSSIFSPANELDNDVSFQGLNFDRNDLPNLSGVLSEPSDRAPPAI